MKLQTNNDLTTEKVLDAAEVTFATQGYHGTSLREVTKSAGVNLAAVNYHFSDKQSLYLAVLQRGFRALDQSRLAKLSEAEANGGTTRLVSLPLILEIMAQPLFESGAGPSTRSHIAQLVGRSLVEPLPFMEDFVRVEVEPTLARFAQAIRRHVPALSPEEFLWRFSLMVGAMHHSLASLHRMQTRTRGICQDHDGTRALKVFVQFSVSGLLSPLWRP